MYVMYYSLLEGMCNDANHNTSCFGVLGWVGACVWGVWMEGGEERLKEEIFDWRLCFLFIH